MKWSGSWQTLDSDWSDCLLPVPSWTQWVGRIYHICARFWHIFTLQLGIIRMKPSRIQVDIRYLFFRNTSRLTMDFPVAIWLWTTGRWDQQLRSVRADWCRFSIVGCEEREPWQMIWWSKIQTTILNPCHLSMYTIPIVWNGMEIWCDLQRMKDRDIEGFDHWLSTQRSFVS